MSVWPKAHIIVTADNPQQAAELYEAGAHYVLRSAKLCAERLYELLNKFAARFFGTFLATLNVWVLYQIFPLGSQMECPGGAETCDPIEMVYKDPNYIPAVVWAEAILFALFWLVSKAPKKLTLFFSNHCVLSFGWESYRQAFA
eukprot:g24978.t1